MKRRSVLLLLAGSACRTAPPRRLSFGRALIAAASASFPVDEGRTRFCVAELARFADEAEHELSETAPRSSADVLSELMFDRWGFAREVRDTNLDFVLLPGVLERRRGSCVGLGTLFLALADALDRPAWGVMRPGHFYAQTRESAGLRSVELLRGGEAMTDEWYARRFPVPAGSAREYGRPLSGGEAIGVVHYNVGNERRRQLRLPEARAAFLRAIREFPELSEAHASLGAVAQLLGDRQSAVESYARARALNPELPGIEQNLALLNGEDRASLTR